MALIGIDIGSTGTKLVLLEPGKGVLADVSAPADQFSERPAWSEADPAQWWANVCDLVPKLLAAAGLTAAEVAGVAVSGMVPAVLVLDGSGQPLRRAILQNDARAGDEVRRLGEKLAGLDLVELTGSALTQQSVAPTLTWLAEHEPDVWSRTETVVGSYDWVAMQLGAPRHVEWNWALESGLYQLADREFLAPVLAAADLDSSRLCEPRDPGDRIGEVSRMAAAATGLLAGTPLFVGGADHVLSAYAAGLSVPGDWLVKLGGAGDILAVTSEPFLDARLYLDAHPSPGTWLPNGCMASSGSIIRWFAALHGGAAVSELEAEAAASGPAELIVLPYFLGEKSPLHDPDLRGAVLGLHLGSTRGDLYRAVLEGIAYGFRHHVEVFAERGVALGDARVSNGGSRSRIWKQILANAMGVRLWPVLDHPGSSLGAALAAAVGAGIVSDWAAGAAYASVGDPVDPDPALRARYDDAYSIYREAGAVLTGPSHRIARRH